MSRKKLVPKYIVMIMIVMILGTGCGQQVSDSGLVVGVSIPPQEAFVKAVAGDHVSVVTMIPKGASPTNYQPTPKQFVELSEASIYFGIDVPSETNYILPSINQGKNDIRIVDLADVSDAVYDGRYFEEEAHEEETHEEETDEHSHVGRDPHIWLSPKRVIVMVEAIRDELTQMDPDNGAIYEQNASSYIDELKALDDDLEEAFKHITQKHFIMMHPSLGYFADDYGLTMSSIEKDGKEATAVHIEEVIEFANRHNISVIFYQTEFDHSQAETIANEIEGQVVAVDTLSEDYIDNMRSLLAIFEEDY